MTLAQAITEALRRPGSDELAVFVRETFATAWPCGWPEAVVDRGLSPPGVTWESLGADALTADEAIAIGVGLVASGLEARRG